MAHYAVLNENNIVTFVHVGKNENEGGVNWEEYYNAKRTSYNTRGGIHYDSTTNEPSSDQSKAFRKNFAGVGFSYNEELDAFIPPKPFNSWVLNETSCLWEPPIPYPTDDNYYQWSEEQLNWVAIEINSIDNIF
jgi:hypothetical protein